MTNISTLDENEFTSLKHSIKKTIPFEAAKYSDTFLKRRIYGRMNAVKIATYADYEKYVANNKKEQEELQKNLTIHVTDFFRDKSFWEFAQKDLFKEIIKRTNGKREILIWSAGCSSGQEAISIMITFLETDPTIRNKLRIIGTDIEKEVLEKAKHFQYDRLEINGLTTDFINKYFVSKDEKITLKPEYQNVFEFKKHDVLTEDPIRGVAAVFCRNTVIYFSTAAKEELYMKLFNTIDPGTFLILGKTEILLSPANKNFKIYNTHERVYEK